MSEEITKTPLEEVLEATYRRLVAQAHEFVQREQKVRGTLVDLNFDKRSLLNSMRAVNTLVETNPEYFDFEYFKRHGNQLKGYAHSFERDVEGDDPIEALLNWKTCGSNETFCLNQIYDLIGKDDARMFRILLREVVQMIDPVKAQDI